MLLTRDRTGADRIRLTHSVLAQMLGVRRATVSVTADALRNANLIDYTRGTVTILDRGGLERHACECYHITRAHLTRLLGENALPGA
jgi:hypothetical protein